MLATIGKNTAEKEVTNEQNDLQLLEIKEKLQQYVSSNSSAKAKRLLACHAHCFIHLS